jgi:hypothetical protein
MDKRRILENALAAYQKAALSEITFSGEQPITTTMAGALLDEKMDRVKREIERLNTKSY